MDHPQESLRAFFAPRVVAVIGAGRRRGTIGAAIFDNLAHGGFTGRVYPVNAAASEVQGVRAYPTIEAIPEPVDLAVIAVPAGAVEDVVDACIRKQVGAVLVITAGFGECDSGGKRRELALRDRLRAAGIRMVGPNCMGLLNTDPAVHLNASFSPVFPPAGSIAFSSQSGALGLAILEYAQQLNLGISSFVSVGNKADVSSNDLLEYWEHDDRTKVLLLYLESFGNPRRFRTIARRVAREKPILAVKAGRSLSGARAASSHTGALAARDAVVDALFRDAGVVRTDTLEELFDAAALLAHQPLPRGRRVGILTNAGGPGILAADACEASGLSLPSLSPATVAALRGFLPPQASVGNPVDMLATAPAEHYARAIPLLLADDAIDSVLTIFIPPLVTDTADVARAIAGAARGSAKPVLATFFGAAGVPDILAPVPCYVFPESAVRALTHAVAHADWLQRPQQPPHLLDPTTVTAVRAALGPLIAGGGGWLGPAAVAAVLDAAGIPMVATRVVTSAVDAATVGAALGYPLVVKGAGPDILHKTEAHAVFTNVHDRLELERRCADLRARADVREIVVQAQASSGVEMMVGGVADPIFGPVVACGSGGTLVELLHDAVLRLAPLSEDDAREMLCGIRGAALLRGFRGAPPADEAALRRVVLQVAALLEACPEIVELDLNPVIVGPSGVSIVDARIRLARGQEPR